MEKIFAIPTFDKVTIFRIYKKTNNSVERGKMYANGQQAQEKVLSVINQQESAN